jgi:hypothetical protein
MDLRPTEKKLPIRGAVNRFVFAGRWSKSKKYQTCILIFLINIIINRFSEVLTQLFLQWCYQRSNTQILKKFEKIDKNYFSI